MSERRWFDTLFEMNQWVVSELRDLEANGAFQHFRVDYNPNISGVVWFDANWALHMTCSWWGDQDAPLTGMAVYLEWSLADHYESIQTVEGLERAQEAEAGGFAARRYADVAVIVEHFKDTRIGIREIVRDGETAQAIWNGFDPPKREKDLALLSELWGWKFTSQGYWYVIAHVEGMRIHVPLDDMLPLHVEVRSGSYYDPDAFEVFLGKQRRLLTQWRTYRRMINRERVEA